MIKKNRTSRCVFLIVIIICSWHLSEMKSSHAFCQNCVTNKSTKNVIWKSSSACFHLRSFYSNMLFIVTVFEIHRKSLIQHCKRSELPFWEYKSYLKMPKMVHLGEFLKNYCLRFNSVTRQASFNRTIIGEKCLNSNATFWVIFKQCDMIVFENYQNGSYSNFRICILILPVEIIHWKRLLGDFLSNFSHNVSRF